MRQTSRALCDKPLRDTVLLLQCCDSANVRNNVGCFLRLCRAFSQTKQGLYPTLLALRKGYAAPENRWLKQIEMFTPCVLVA